MEVTATHCTNPLDSTVANGSGELTLEAANGDELYATYGGEVTFVEFPFLGYSADHEFTGAYLGEETMFPLIWEYIEGCGAQPWLLNSSIGT